MAIIKSDKTKRGNEIKISIQQIKSVANKIGDIIKFLQKARKDRARISLQVLYKSPKTCSITSHELIRPYKFEITMSLNSLIALGMQRFKTGVLA